MSGDAIISTRQTSTPHSFYLILFFLSSASPVTISLSIPFSVLQNTVTSLRKCPGWFAL